jgi:hypothetical protein
MLFFFIITRFRYQHLALKNTGYDGRRVWAVSCPVGLCLFQSDKDMHTHISVKSTLTRCLRRQNFSMYCIFMHWQRYSLI